MPEKDPYRLLKYVALGAGEGVVAGWIFLLILIKLDAVGLGIGLGSLIDRSPDGPLALIMLLWFFGVTFGMVGIAWRVMVLLPDEKD